MKISVTFDPVFDFFLAGRHKRNDLVYALTRRASIKDIIESLGIPHTEVGRLCFNGQDFNFSFIPDTPGNLTAHGIDPPFDVLTPSLLRPEPLNRIRFIADVNVLKLGRLLILLGFDVACSSSFSDEQIADLSASESRIVLTRDTSLLKRRKIVFARRIRSDLPYDQVVEVVDFFGLHAQTAFFSRCTQCNHPLAKVAKTDILHLLEPKTKKYFTDFFQCPGCLKIFWKGSHYDAMTEKFSQLGMISRKE
ncbi:MAG: Mut7-C RNAse domain-containing protein [Desulfotignum sp.]